ncbi:MAG: hypothetical protein V4548_12820 [Bacteroidota bacterium]
MKRFKIIIVLMFSNISFGQIPKGTLQYKYYEYCNENLTELGKISEFPLFKTNELCSIKQCFRNISYSKVNKIIYKRIIELARVNFENKIYLYLIDGKGSIDLAEKKNENIEDDNNLIYISIDDFINVKEITKGRELYNSETKKLMKN